MQQTCTLCQQDRLAKKFKPLYGKDVCRKCYYRFANRRQLAFILDIFLIRIAAYALLVFAFQFVTVDASNQEYYTGLATLLMIGLIYFMVLVKDGFSGHSVGKLVTGVQVLDVNSRKPGNWLHSVKRNLPVLIPIVPLVIAYQLQKGSRMGDGWADTKVIWKKYRDHPVFTGEEVVDQESIDYTRPETDGASDVSNPFSPPVR